MASASASVAGSPQTLRAVSASGIGIGVRESSYCRNGDGALTAPQTPRFTAAGVPVVRSTSPTAAARTNGEYTAARRAKEEKMRQALMSGQVPVPSPATPIARAQGYGSTLPPVLQGLTNTFSPSSNQANLLADTTNTGTIPAAGCSGVRSLRRFNITRNASSSNLLKTASAQKRRYGGPAPAVLVEQITQNFAVKKRRTTPVTTVPSKQQRGDAPAQSLSTSTRETTSTVATTTPSRKRPVINETERLWREEQKSSVSAAKTKLLNYSSSRRKGGDIQAEDEEDRLARELEKFAMAVDSGDDADDGADGDLEEKNASMNPKLTDTDNAILSLRLLPSPTPISASPSRPPNKTSQKFKPKHTDRSRKEPVFSTSRDHTCPVMNKNMLDTVKSTTTQPQPQAPPSTIELMDMGMDIAKDRENDDENESEGEYVYETYVRRPIHEIFPNPSSISNYNAAYNDHNNNQNNNNKNANDYNCDDGSLYRELGIDPSRMDIGLVVITEEDEELWASLVAGDVDEDKWNTDDEDSNGMFVYNGLLFLYSRIPFSFFCFLPFFPQNPLTRTEFYFIFYVFSAEDNPANDYPEEELSEADEDDDPTAIYRRYRHGSDDEEFDINEDHFRSDDQEQEEWENDNDNDDYIRVGRHYGYNRYNHHDEDLIHSLQQYT